MRKKKVTAFLSAGLMLFLSGCAGFGNTSDFQRGLTDYAFTMASYSATDREAREITPAYAKKTDRMRYVGVFYWLWMGNNDHQFGVYDNTKLLSTDAGREALFKTVNPPGEGMENASPLNYMHWTNEPMFGYYNSSDPWVIARHIEMLTMADIDFIFLDATNYYDYSVNLNQNAESANIKGSGVAVLDTLLEYYNQGWDVPKVVFYTNSCSGERAQEIFEHYYRKGKYEDLWFKPNGKPLIVGTTENNNGASDMDVNNPAQYSNISASLQEYFEVKESQWPTKSVQPNGFPWMSWDYPQYYHSESKTINVSVAQHSRTHILFNLQHKWSSKGYDYHTDTIETNWAAGKNFENEWETVFSYEEDGKEIEYVTVTGWNEWVVQKTKTDDSYYFDGGNNPTGMMMVDNFSAEYSRDIEPDKEYYKDNVYMQLVRNVRKLKYDALSEGTSIVWGKNTVKSFSNFNKNAATYKDFTGDARARDFYGFDIRNSSRFKNLDGSWYKDDTNRNDIEEVKVATDEENLYIGIVTKDEVVAYSGGDNWMNVLVKTGASNATNSFEGYDYIINRSPDGSKTTIEKSTGGWNWSKVGDAQIEVTGNTVFLKIPLSSLGLSADNVRFEFKVADNVQKPSWYDVTDAEHDVAYYYITGDSAPIGRLNYTYGY